MLIAIDTSTTTTGIACYTQDGLLGESSWHSQRNHTAQTMPHLALLLQHVGYTPHDIRVVSVALGPGSWSGLRVGMSIAKGIALAGNIPLIGIGTLDALAFQYQRAAMPIYPLIHLGRDRYATAMFQYTSDGWQRLSAYRNTTIAELSNEVQQQALFCGDVSAAVQHTLMSTLHSNAFFSHDAVQIRRPGYLAYLAWQRFMAGEHDDVATLEPLYLAEPVKQA